MPTTRYHYDPLNRLIDSAGSQRFYNKARLATEIQGGVPRRVFQVGDQLLAEGGAGVSNLLATDLQRSVLHTVNPDKGQPIAYNVYGHRSAESGLSSLLGFNGERPEPVTGNYLLGNGYRAFNPVLMRFNSPDSWSPFGEGGINCYGYVMGNPINRVDPSGHFIKGLWQAVSNLLGFAPPKALPFPRPKLPYNKAEGYILGFKEIDKNTYAGYLVGKGGKTDTVVAIAHGAGLHHMEGVGMVGFIKAGQRPMVAPEYAELLKREIDFRGVKKIQLIACGTANGGSKSFGQNLSDYTGLYVDTYFGEVITVPGEVLNTSRKTVGGYDVASYIRGTLPYVNQEDTANNIGAFMGFNHSKVSFSPRMSQIRKL